MVDFVVDMVAQIATRGEDGDEQTSRVFKRFATMILPRMRADLATVPEEDMRLWLRGLQQKLADILGDEPILADAEVLRLVTDTDVDADAEVLRLVTDTDVDANIMDLPTG